MFDRFADAAERFVASAVFFSACVLVVLLWLPSYFVTHDINTWQLIINTLTTVITFLLVALLQNTQARFENAVNTRLQAIQDHLGISDQVTDEGNQG